MSGQQWARAGDDGFCAEVIDFDPAGKFHESLVFHPVPPDLAGWIDGGYRWSGAGWDEPTPGHTAEKKARAARERFTALIQERLDAFARSRGYDGILSAASYAASLNPQFAAEGRCAVEARDAVWARAYELLAEYAAAGTIPEWEDIARELPAPEWPK
jgi:hypothetical protein